MFTQIKTNHELKTSDLETNFRNIHKAGRKVEPKSRPSASSSLCPRQIAFGLKVDPFYADMPKALSYYGSIGNAIESEALRRYRDAGQLVLSQWKIPKELMTGLDVGGIIDAIIEVNGVTALIDIKTIGVVETESYISLAANEVQNLIGGNDIIITSDDERIKQTVEKGSKESHFAQLQLYAAITGLPNVYLQMLSRRVQDKFNVSDTTPTVRFEAVPVDESILKKRVGAVMYGVRCAELGLIPDVLLGIKKTHCSDAFCSFQDYCWKEKHKFKSNLKPITVETSRELKIEAYEKATQYLSLIDERKELTLKLIKKEHDKRVKEGKEL